MKTYIVIEKAANPFVDPVEVSSVLTLLDQRKKQKETDYSAPVHHCEDAVSQTRGYDRERTVETQGISPLV